MQVKYLWNYLYFKDEVDFTGCFSKEELFNNFISSTKIYLFKVSVFSGVMISKLHFSRNLSIFSNFPVCKDLSKATSSLLISFVSVVICP